MRPFLYLVGFWTAMLSCILLVRFQCAATWPRYTDIGPAVLLLPLTIALVTAAGQTFRRAHLLASLLTVTAIASVGLSASHLHRKNILAGTGTYQRADLSYCSAVAQRLIRIGESREKYTKEQRELLDLLNVGLDDWTSRVIAQNVGASESSNKRIDLAFQRGALATLALDIYPRPELASEVADYLSKESEWLQRELKHAQELEGELNSQHQEASQTYERLLDAEPEDRVPQALSNAAAELTDLETQSQNLRKSIQRMETRQRLRALMDTLPQGLNAEYPWLKLPVQIPGGPWWSWSFLSFVVTVVIYLLVGLLIQAFWRPHAIEAAQQKSTFLRLYVHTAAAAMLVIAFVL